MYSLDITCEQNLWPPILYGKKSFKYFEKIIVCFTMLKVYTVNFWKFSTFKIITYKSCKKINTLYSWKKFDPLFYIVNNILKIIFKLPINEGLVKVYVYQSWIQLSFKCNPDKYLKWKYNHFSAIFNCTFGYLVEFNWIQKKIHIKDILIM